MYSMRPVTGLVAEMRNQTRSNRIDGTHWPTLGAARLQRLICVLHWHVSRCQNVSKHLPTCVADGSARDVVSSLGIKLNHQAVKSHATKHRSFHHAVKIQKENRKLVNSVPGNRTPGVTALSHGLQVRASNVTSTPARKVLCDC